LIKILSYKGKKIVKTKEKRERGSRRGRRRKRRDKPCSQSNQKQHTTLV
jgi:hypothetical protein